MAGFIKYLAARMGYQNNAKTAYGRTNGIFINVLSTGSSSFVVRAYGKREDGIDLYDLNAFLDRKWRGLKVYDAQKDEISVWMNVDCLWTKNEENLKALIQGFSAHLAERGYRSGCGFCAASEHLSYTLQDRWVMEVCDACHENLKSEAASMEAERKTTGSYLRGALGAALGGAVGIIPWVLIGALGYVAAISGLIMAWLSYKGYRLLGGKRGRGMVWIIILVLIVFTYIGVMTSTYFDTVRQNGNTTADNTYWTFLTLPLTRGGDMPLIWFDLALGWLFATFGSFGMIRRAGRESKGKDLAVRRISGDP